MHLTPGQVVPRVTGLNADATGNLTLDVAHDASGTITGGNVVFYVNYRFPGSVTITGLALHQGARGSNGPVVLDAAVGTITDCDGRGNLTKVVSGASASLLQALLTTPRGYYVDLTTSATTGGALRDQLAVARPALRPDKVSCGCVGRSPHPQEYDRDEPVEGISCRGAAARGAQPRAAARGASRADHAASAFTTC